MKCQDPFLAKCPPQYLQMSLMGTTISMSHLPMPHPMGHLPMFHHKFRLSFIAHSWGLWACMCVKSSHSLWCLMMPVDVALVAWTSCTPSRKEADLSHSYCLSQGWAQTLASPLRASIREVFSWGAAPVAGTPNPRLSGKIIKDSAYLQRRKRLSRMLRACSIWKHLWLSKERPITMCLAPSRTLFCSRRKSSPSR